MQQIGRYEVVRSLGHGGMGEVYLARDPKLERQIAIKLLHRDDGPARGLFEREAKALAALNHPNIVTVFEIAELDNGQQFIAMEYLPGRSLRDLLQHDKPARDDLVAICGQVATALAAAHEAGILHRDIKPENVVVGRGLAVKVVDFGIARRLDAPSSNDPDRPRRPTARATEIIDMFTRTLRAEIDPTLATDVPLTDVTRTVFGTPAYMAPEVLLGKPSSVASDIYSLGVMLFECLSGRRPYEAPQLHEVIARVIDGDPPPRLDDPHAELAERMIARDPEKRPGLTEIAKALSRRRSTIAATPTKRRWVIPGVVTLCLGAAAAFAVSRSREPPASAAIDRGTVLIRDLDVVTLPSYGNPPDPRAFAQVIAMLLKSSGVSTVTLERPGHPDDATWIDAARTNQANLVVRGSLVESGGGVVGRFEVLEMSGRRWTTELAGQPDRVADLVAKVAAWIAAIARPDNQTTPTGALVAQELLKRGTAELREHSAHTARTFLEQATVADPTSAEAWDRYAASLAMIAAKVATLVAAAERAYEVAPEGTRKRILHATLLVYRAEFAKALAELTPLETTELEATDRRDVLFQIGECHWHEGRHDLGYQYFKRTLEIDSAFAEAAGHAGEYGIARRDETIAREYLRLQRASLDYAAFAAGHYEELATHGKPPFDTWAKIVLGLPRPPPSDPDYTDERLTAAVLRTDRATIDRELGQLLAHVEPFTAASSSRLVHMCELMIAAELREQAKAILDVLRVRQPTYNFKRLSILAAPMLGSPKFERARLTERLASLQSAIDAELAGDRATAAKLLGELVRNPTFEWDFVERLALRRNLRALGRVKDAQVVCADTLRPPVMRPVFEVVRARCLE